MRYRRVFLTEDHIRGTRVCFPDHTARQLSKVLRLSAGDLVRVSEGRKEYLVRLSQGPEGKLEGDIVEVFSASDTVAVGLHLAFGCVRPGPMAEILRHGTELGVRRFIPLLCARSNRRPAEKKARWETVIKSACAQCGRTEIPGVDVPTPFYELLDRGMETAGGIIMAAGESSIPLIAVLDELDVDDLTLLVGPEGGFNQHEIGAALEAGYRTASLGPHTLRTETAAIASVSVAAAWGSAAAGRGTAAMPTTRDS